MGDWTVGTAGCITTCYKLIEFKFGCHPHDDFMPERALASNLAVKAVPQCAEPGLPTFDCLVLGLCQLQPGRKSS
jgi:hypothetical protein